MNGFLFFNREGRLSMGRWQRERGQGLLEFALILGLLLLIIMGIIDFGRVLFIYTSIFNAAREGTRHGAVNPWSPAEVYDLSLSNILLVDPNDVSVAVCCDTGPNTSTFYCDATASADWACELGGRPDPSTGGATAGSAQIGDRVVVSATYDVDLITPMMAGIVSQLPVRTQSARTIATLGEALPPPTGGGGGGGGTEICNNGVDDDGDGAVDCDDPDCSADPLCTSEITLEVTADPQQVQSGEVVTFTYTVQNTGAIALDVTVEDSFGNVIDLGNVAAGGSASTTVLQVIYNTTTNNVDAHGSDSGTELATASDSVTVEVIGPALDLTVFADPAAVQTGGVVTFTYSVRNSGDVELENITLTDSFGSSLDTVASLPVGATVYWEVTRVLVQRTTNQVVAQGAHPGGTVEDVESVTVEVLFTPIEIYEPLLEGATVITGTGEPGWPISIRDVMSDTFPEQSVTVDLDGNFRFEGLPGLVAGHVIVVQGESGYELWDSALVGATDLEPILPGYHSDIYFCHGRTVITGTAEPGRTVSLFVPDTSYRDSVTVAAGGSFTFNLPTWQPLQAGQTVDISGYGESVTVEVWSCTDREYVIIRPQCGPAGQTTVEVEGYNWPASSGALKNIGIYWDGEGNNVATIDAAPHFVTDFSVNVTAPMSHTILVRSEKSNGSPTGGYSVEAYFLAPCPSPNLVVTDLQLLTTGVLSTYQPLDFSVTVANIGTKAVNSMFWVDLFDGSPVLQTPGAAWGGVSALGIGDSRTLTVTVRGGLTTTGTHQIYAYADSWEYVTELSETDNEGGPVVVEVTAEGEPPVTPGGTATIAGETWVSLSGIPVPQGRTMVRCTHEGGTVYETFSDAEGKYEFNNLPAGDYDVLAETWIDGVRYSRIYSGVTAVADQTTIQIIVMYRD